jgi:hypothetical protein
MWGISPFLPTHGPGNTRSHDVYVHRKEEEVNRPIRTATLALVAAAVGFTSPAIASAEPKEWDIGAYDQCVSSFDGNPAASAADNKRWVDHVKVCCEKTGGVY